MLHKAAECSKENKQLGAWVGAQLVEAIEEVGSENVVQVITDSASDCVAARAIVADTFTNVKAAPCASHR